MTLSIDSTYETKRLKYRELFPVLKKETYLNHAAHAPWSKLALEGLQVMMRGMSESPMLPYEAWEEESMKTRSLMGEFLGASADEIFFNFNTSLSLFLMTHLVPWKPGENIIVPDRAFPSIVMPAKLLTQWGVQARKVDTVDGLISEDALIGSIDDNTKMMIVPLVNFLTGQRLDIPKLSKVCRQKGVFLVVDAIQAAGPIKIDVKALGCHALCFGSPKWMFGPMGIGTVYIEKDVIRRMLIPQMGMWSVKEPWNFFDYDQELIDSAMVYEAGCMNYLIHYGFNPNVEMFLDLGREKTEKYLLEITGDFYDKLVEKGAKVITPREDLRRAAIVTFDAKSTGWDDAEKLRRHLESKKIIVAVRMGMVRVSPHFYNTPDELDLCLNAIFDTE